MKGQYEKGVRHIMGKDVDLANDAIGVILVDLSIYVANLDTDESLANITVAAIIGEKLLTGKILDGTTFRADNVVFPAVPDTDPQIGAYVVFLDTGDLNTSWILYYDDESPPFPITPDGTEISIEWDAGPNGIFKQ